jgi:hypothetical protein
MKCTISSDKTIMGRWMKKGDIVSAIRSQKVFDSMVKRGEINLSTISQTRYVVCGCGEEGCGFISMARNLSPGAARKP